MEKVDSSEVIWYLNLLSLGILNHKNGKVMYEGEFKNNNYEGKGLPFNEEINELK